MVLSLIVLSMVRSIISARLVPNGVTMNETVAQKRNGIAGLSDTELTLAPQKGNAPDPRLVELVRLLARRAAQEWYEQIAEQHCPRRS